MSSLDPVLMSRILTGLTLFVHIVLATIGVGFRLCWLWRNGGFGQGTTIIRLPGAGRGDM